MFIRSVIDASVDVHKIVIQGHISFVIYTTLDNIILLLVDMPLNQFNINLCCNFILWYFGPCKDTFVKLENEKVHISCKIRIKMAFLNADILVEYCFCSSAIVNILGPNRRSMESEKNGVIRKRHGNCQNFIPW